MGFWSRLLKRDNGDRTINIQVTSVGGIPPSRQISDPFEELYQIGKAIMPPYDPAQLVMLAETNEVHAAALEAVAADTVGQGWHWEAIRPGADEAYRDEIALVLDELNPEHTFAELLYQAAWELRAVGWSAWEVVRDEDGSIGAVYPIPAHTLRLTRDRNLFVQEVNGRFRYFKAFGLEATVDGETGEYTDDTDDPASEVIFFTRYHGRSRYGVPSWISCIPSIAEYNAIRDYSVAFFDSSGAVGRIVRLQAPATLPLEQYIDELKTELDNAIGQPRRTLVLGFPNDVSFAVDRLGPDVQEASFIRRREDLVKAILMAHSVPPYRIGWAVLGPMSRDTEVFTLQGWKPIADVAVGEPVLTYQSASHELQFQRVEQTHRYFYESLVTLEGPTGIAIHASPDHRMWVALNDGPYQWMTAGALLELHVRHPDMVMRMKAAAPPARQDEATWRLILRHWHGIIDMHREDRPDLIWIWTDRSNTYRAKDAYQANLFQLTALVAGVASSVSGNIVRAHDTDEILVTRVGLVPYHDDAFCLTVANGALVYRRAGHVFIAGNSLGGNAAREMIRAYRRGVIEPLQMVLENRINKTLFSGKGLQLVPAGWRWRLNNLDFQETELQLNIATRAIDRAIITPNEARATLGFRPIDDEALNTFYLAGKPITSVERPPELPAEASSGRTPQQGTNSLQDRAKAWAQGRMRERKPWQP